MAFESETRALLPEGLSARRASSTAGERHEGATRRVHRPYPDQKIRARSTHSLSGPSFLL
eukprot:817774-Pleurochrysis_carterae.AAC.1